MGVVRNKLIQILERIDAWFESKVDYIGTESTPLWHGILIEMPFAVMWWLTNVLKNKITGEDES